MDLNKTQRILDKINSLYKNIGVDDNVSAIERDLMLSYIRNLYETFLDESTANKATPSTPRVKTAAPPPVTEPVYQKEVVPPPPPRKKPVIIQVPDSIKEYAVPPPAQPAPTSPAPVAVTPPPAPIPTPEPTPEPPKPEIQAEHTELFGQNHEVKELSDRLSGTPIKNLKKAMGLNEKILTINELFGGDHKAFDAALAELNDLKDFKEAKAYMSEHLAKKYDWSSDAKIKKAQIFIKLVRRRYN